MDHFEELKKYKELLDEGIITQEEFEESKRKVLARSEALAGRVQEQAPAPAPAPAVETEPKPEPAAAPAPASAPAPATAPDMEPAVEPVPASASVSEEKAGSVDDSISAVSGSPENVVEFEPTENASAEKTASKAKSNKLKIVLIGAVCAIAVIAIVAAVFLRGDTGKIQGSWEAAAIVSDGNASAPIGSIGASLEVKGKKWTMVLNGTETSTYSGTITNSEKTTTSDGTEAYFFDFHQASGNTLKAAYLAASESIMVCASSKFDSDNGIIFTKK